MLHLSAGVMIGFGLAGSSFTVVIGAFGKLMPPQWRSLAFGAGTAAGSFGQFLFSPLAVALIDGYGWRHTLVGSVHNLSQCAGRPATSSRCKSDTVKE
jgi:MFS family permease